MKYLIDFSIFASPTQAYGNVTGELEFLNGPQLGAEVTLFDTLALKVTYVLFVKGNEGSCVISLEDVVCHSRSEAVNLGKRLEIELGKR